MHGKYPQSYSVDVCKFLAYEIKSFHIVRMNISNLSRLVSSMTEI